MVHTADSLDFGLITHAKLNRMLNHSESEEAKFEFVFPLSLKDMMTHT